MARAGRVEAFMMVDEERRATGAQRVSVQTLVEMCGRDVAGEPTFEAEAVDVSGRGLHVRTAYLPEIGSPLVCRLEDRGREIIAEGEVVWRKPDARGGEFGLMFTALDSGSVAALRDLCGPEPAAPERKPAEKEPEDVAPGADPGSRVRLHIDGLGAPMKALVREAAPKKLKVGSNLEFLKVGRHLEIESLGQDSRRGAYIDAIDVLVDPQSGVPQLVVAMHYDDVGDTTPEPSVVDRVPSSARGASDVPADLPLRQSPARQEMAESSEFESIDSDDPEPFEAPGPADEVVSDANVLRGRLGTAAANAGRVAKQGGDTLARWGAKAAGGMGRLLKDAGAKALELRRKSNDGKPHPRTTSLPPGGGLSSEGRRLRPQSAAARARPPESESNAGPAKEKPRQVRRIAAGAALLVLVAGVGALAFHRPAAPPGSKTSGPSAAVSVAAADVKEVDSQGNPVVNAKVQRLTAPAPSASQGLTAEVPLFGPTPMATIEPAPLGPNPEASAQAAAQTPPAADQGAQSPPPVADEAFDDQPKEGDSKEDSSKRSGADLKPWGKGTVKTPTIHRLRLDGPGTAIKGEISSSGFAVFLPGRKIMEAPGGIAKRDKRIVKVSSQNSAAGARVSFKFREGVPGYRVRLRKDFVEFLISAPASAKK
jgi:hypothetical protein